MGMDRELEPKTRRRAIRRRAAAAAGGLVLAAAVFFRLPGWLRPAVARTRIRTARVERGPVEAVIAASGTVVPAAEQVVSSPLEARVMKIRRRLGAVVAPGDEIVQLDTSSFQLERRRLADQMEQKTNLEEQLRLALEKSLIDLAGALETKRLDADLLEARAEQNRRLGQDGLVSAATLRVAEVEAKKAQIEVRQLTAAARKLTVAQLAALALDLRVLTKDRAEVERQIALATTRAGRAGVLAWVVTEEGATVHKGDVLARIADVDSFRVEATVSDIHSARLRQGLPVRVVLDDDELAGRLASIHPLIEDGAVKFTVDLVDLVDFVGPRSCGAVGAGASWIKKLRANLRVDVLVVTARRADALRLRKGPFAEGAGLVDVFVVQGGEAVRRRVRLGMVGYDYCEIEAGLQAGDEVIVSDMKEYLHLHRVALK